MNTDLSGQFISAEICDDPIDIDLMTAAVECQRCGSDDGIVAILRLPDFPDCGFLAVCGRCYRELTISSLGQVV
jgi:hypothetical protein